MTFSAILRRRFSSFRPIGYGSQFTSLPSHPSHFWFSSYLLNFNLLGASSWLGIMQCPVDRIGEELTVRNEKL